MNDIPTLAELVQVNIFLYDIDNVDGAMVGGLVQRSFGEPSNTVQLTCYNRHICYLSNINAFFKACFLPIVETISL